MYHLSDGTMLGGGPGGRIFGGGGGGGRFSMSFSVVISLVCVDTISLISTPLSEGMLDETLTMELGEEIKATSLRFGWLYRYTWDLSLT